MYSGGIGLGEPVVVAALVKHHVQQRHDRADGHAEYRACRRGRAAKPLLHCNRGEDESGDDLEQHLQHLVYGCRDHVAVALTIAAVGRDEAHEQDRRSHGADAGRGVGVFKVGRGEPVGQQEQYQREHKADDGKRPARNAEGLFLLTGAAVCVRLRDKARQRHRQTGGRQREKDVVYIVGAEEHGISLVAENIAERDLIDEAQQLHDDDADSEDGGAMHIVLSFYPVH